MTSVLITRSESQGSKLKSEFESMGITVMLQPAIEILPPESWSEVDRVISCLVEFDWILFSSGNAVKFFTSRLNGIKFPESLKVGVVGNATDDIFFELTGKRADIVPEISNAENLLAKVLSVENIVQKRFLLPRANRGRDILSKGIIESGGIVEEITAYRSIDCKEPKEEIVELMKQNKINWVTVTSPAIAESLVNMFGELLRKTKIISISPITTAKLNALGHPPTKESKETTTEGIIKEIM
jgi:uroporphyrinogen III methyltransferase/synthase